MLADDITFNLSGFFRNDRYPDSTFDQEENRWSIEAGITNNFQKRFLAGLSIALRERDSNIDLNDYRDNRLIFSLVLEL